MAHLFLCLNIFLIQLGCESGQDWSFGNAEIKSSSSSDSRVHLLKPFNCVNSVVNESFFLVGLEFDPWACLAASYLYFFIILQMPWRHKWPLMALRSPARLSGLIKLPKAQICLISSESDSCWDKSQIICLSSRTQSQQWSSEKKELQVIIFGSWIC